jgi:homoserine acetyltransferase
MEEIKVYRIPTLSLANGQVLQDVRVAYKSINSTSKDGTVLIPTCFGGKINSTLTFTKGPVRALSKYHVVIAAMLGNGESSSPSNHPGFPKPGELRYQDVIYAHYQLLTEGLAVERLEAVVGFSMGGQQAYHWAVMYPAFVKRAVVICGSARTSAHNYAFIEGPICALENSEDYVTGKAKQVEGQHSAERYTRGTAAFGRAYAAWLTSAEWFDQGCWSNDKLKTVEDWIRTEEEDTMSWNADDLLVLARMWQMGNIGSLVKDEQLSQLGGGKGNDEKVKEALESIQAKVLLMPCSHDQYFRPGPNKNDLNYLKHGRLAVIESIWGHIAGGGANEQDTLFMDKQIGEFMIE